MQVTGILVMSLGLLACAPAVAGDIYQWTDSSGAVHISDEVPPQYKASAKVVGSNESNAVDAKDQAAARKRAADDAGLLKQLDRSAPKPAAAAAPGPAATPAGPANCAAMWAAYQASQACYAPYRIQNGGLRGGSNCTDVPDPTVQCGTVPPSTN